MAPAAAILKDDDSAGIRQPGRIASPVQRAAFAEARRHTRRVRFLKRLLPVLAISLAAGFITFSWIITPQKISVDVAASGIVDGKLVMASPKLDGFTKEKRPYTMTASRAIQEFGNMDSFGLEGIVAKLPLSATSIAAITAATGTYDNKSGKLDITSPISVVTSDGMEADLLNAHIDVTSGSLKTSHPVDIRVDGSRITADSMSVEDNGKVIVFENTVRLLLKPRSSVDTNQAAAAGQEPK